MNTEKYIQAYNHLMQHLHETLGDSDYSTADALEIAKEKTSELNDLTATEVNQISNYVSRDIDHAANSVSHRRRDAFSEWLKFDIDLLENFALDAFMSLADKTRLELA
jgi:SRSO17 transposase